MVGLILLFWVFVGIGLLILTIAIVNALIDKWYSHVHRRNIESDKSPMQLEIEKEERELNKLIEYRENITRLKNIERKKIKILEELEDSEWLCEICEEDFPSEDALLMHNNSNHSEPFYYRYK